jgi:hypothetical protein
MDPNHYAMLRATRLAVRTFKQRIVDECGIGTDVPNAMLIAQGPQVLTTVAVDPHDPMTVINVATTVGLSDADLVIGVVECYMATDGDNDRKLAAAFADGDPTVVESFLYYIIPRAGPSRTLTDAYRYEHKRIVWIDVGRPEVVLSETGRRMERMIRTGFRAQETRPGPAVIQPGSQLRNVGHTDLGDGGLLVEYALTLACPCGSGRPMNQCCLLNN